jgi:hypothetical protein
VNCFIENEFSTEILLTTFLVALVFKSWGDVHDGPISALSLAPFNNDLMLSVGGTVLAIWKDTIMV